MIRRDEVSQSSLSKRKRERERESLLVCQRITFLLAFFAPRGLRLMGCFFFSFSFASSDSFLPSFILLLCRVTPHITNWAQGWDQKTVRLQPPSLCLSFSLYFSAPSSLSSQENTRSSIFFSFSILLFLLQDWVGTEKNSQKSQFIW